jgi:D-alanyl-lipoteichoic acid acyltransferase DltB (MBOAT superfamily)
VSGFWHGANWTFIAWGLLHALFFVPLLLIGKNRKHLNNPAEGKSIPNIKEFCQILSTFTLVTFAWIFFRANSIGDAIDYIAKIFSYASFSLSKIQQIEILTACYFIIIFVFVEWIGREKQYAIANLGTKRKVIRWGLYYLIVFTIVLFAGKEQQFIYFQF